MNSKRSGRSRPSMVVGIGMGLGMAALSLGATAQAAWLGTNSKAYTMDNAVQLGAVPETQTLHIALGLKLQNESALDDFLAHAHTLYDRQYGATLSGAEFASKYAPTQRQVDTVTAYLSRAGFTNIKVAANRLLVTADARPSLIESAFNTRLRQFNLSGRKVFANIVDVLVPDTLGGLVHSVLGLQNADQAHPAFAYPNATTAASGVTGHNPTAFQAIYDTVGVALGTGTDIGIIAEGDLSVTVSDLLAFESQNGITPVPLHFVPAEATSTNTGNSIEWMLDSQTIVGITGGVRNLYFYNAATLGNADLAVAFNQAVTDNVVKAVNVSLGLCEQSDHSSGAMATDDAIFKQAMAQGQTFFVSTGDDGANTGCGSQRGLFKATSYPAVSPYVVAVGGTTLTTSGNSYVSETAWTGGGGGVSKFESAPSWQTPVTGSAMREVPDVAMDADPNSGAILVDGSSTTQIGGTSLSAPLATGTWARVQSSHGNTLGFAAPLIYAAVGKSPTPFHDVTKGSNGIAILGIPLGGYKAGVGYDEVTGFGTFDVAHFNTVVGH
jgi:pseudomonalisin